MKVDHIWATVTISSHIFILTIVFFLRVRSWTLCAQWTCHVLQTRLSCVPVFHIMCHQLVYSYVSVPVSRVFLLVLLQTVDSSPYVSRLRLFFFHLVDSSMLTIIAYAFPFEVRRLVSRLVISGL